MADQSISAIELERELKAHKLITEGEHKGKFVANSGFATLHPSPSVSFTEHQRIIEAGFDVLVFDTKS
jgi:hypothetical protein